jgi:hypothetical protein
MTNNSQESSPHFFHHHVRDTIEISARFDVQRSHAEPYAIEMNNRGKCPVAIHGLWKNSRGTRQMFITMQTTACSFIGSSEQRLIAVDRLGNDAEI